MASSAAAAGSDLGATIEHRLQASHHPVYASLLSNFPRPRPVEAFYTIADYTSAHAFELIVSVYSNRATAKTAYDRDLAHNLKYGIPDASKIVLVGRVEYIGTTGPLNHTSGMAPALPPKRFSAMVALAEG